MGNLKLTSSAFSDGGEIPRKCGYKNGNISPSLTFSGSPTEAKSLVLIMDDPDAMGAVGKVWVHWIIWNIHPDCPGTAEDGFLISDGPIIEDTQEGMTDFGEVGYGGPAPPDKRHTYVFKLYALDCKELTCADGKATKADVEKAMEGHILDQATLKGTYAP